MRRPLLQAQLKTIELSPEKPNRPPSVADLIAEGSDLHKNGGDRTAFESRTLAFVALHPEEAEKLWSKLGYSKQDEPENPPGMLRVYTEPEGTGLVRGMADADPLKAFSWVRENAPQYLEHVFISWIRKDGPAAVEALLSLPRENELRDALVRFAAGWPPNGHAGHVTRFLEPSIRDALRHVNLPPGGLR
jgi:hypothetical protein